MNERDWLNEIRIFTAVADKLSFSLAAESLGVTSSAVSKAISRIGARLKTKLFAYDSRRPVDRDR